MLDLGFSTRNLYAAMHLRTTYLLSDGSEKTGTGTGFIVQRPPSDFFLVTARHVVDPLRAIPKHVGATYVKTEVTGWKYVADVTQQEALRFTLVGDVLYPDDAEVDIAVLPVINLVDYNHVALDAFIPISLLSESSEFDSDIRTGDFIAAPGYAPLPDVETDRPVLLTGIVAGDPRVPVRVTPSGFAAKAVLYQSLSRSGLSGAPVFATQRGLQFGSGISGPPHRPMRVIGVNAGSFIDPQTMPMQFSYFTRSDEILALLGRQASGESKAP